MFLFFIQDKAFKTLKKQVEDTYLDQGPTEQIPEDNQFVTESNLKVAIGAIYGKTLTYSISQLELEKVRLIGKDFQDRKTKPISFSESWVLKRI